MRNDRTFTPHNRTIPTPSSGQSYGIELDRYLDQLLGDALDKPNPAGDTPAVAPRRSDKTTARSAQTNTLFGFSRLIQSPGSATSTS